MVTAVEALADAGGEEDGGGDAGHDGIAGVAEHDRRGDADDDISEDAAAYGGDDAQDEDAEKVQLLPDAHHGTADGEGDDADHLHHVKDIQDNSHTHSPFSCCV